MAAPKETVWELDDHTVGKHLVLRGYLDAWLPIISRYQGRVLFVDGFAGPGKYAGGQDGSPVVALRALAEHKATIKAEVIFLLIEKDAARAEHLSKLVDEWRPRLPANAKVYIESEGFVETMTGLLDSAGELAPAFVMIDPFGVKDTPMSVIRRILQKDRAEVYISFMYEWINRFKGSPEFEPHLDELFGCPDWRKGLEIKGAAARKEFFYQLYADCLKKAGARHVVKFELYEGNRLVYALFFATKHSTGSDKMKAAMWKVAPFGNFSFRGGRAPQLQLGIEEPDFKPLRQALKTEFGGRGWISIEEVEEFVRSDRTDYHSSQIKRPVLVPMEKADEIEVDATTRKKARTYPPGTRLRFF